MRRRKKLQIQEEVQLNLTPLIDILFVILVMFIVVAPLLNMEKVELVGASPQLTETLQQQSSITLHVRRDNSILLNTHPVTVEQLPTLLAKAKQKFPTATPQVFHDKQASFGTYQTLKQALERAGFKEMDIVLKPE